MTVDDALTTQTSAVAVITPPEGGPWGTYVLSVCPKPPSGAPNWDACPKTTCTAAQVAACPIAGLSAGALYTLSGVALRGDTSSVRSTPDDFSTPAWPCVRRRACWVACAATAAAARGACRRIACLLERPCLLPAPAARRLPQGAADAHPAPAPAPSPLQPLIAALPRWPSLQSPSILAPQLQR